MGTAAMKLKDACSLEEKAMTNLDSILKNRDITLPTKVHIVKAIVFPVVTYGCESWTIKKAGCWRTDAFELWCWRRLLTVPWTARRLSQSILKEVNPEYSLEGLMLKLKLQYLGHLMRRADSLEKTLMVGKIEGRRRRGWQRMRRLDGCRPWGCRIRQDWATRQQQQQSHHVTLQSHSWAYIQRESWSERIRAPQRSVQHGLQQPRHGHNLTGDRGVGKDDVEHIYNGLLLSH